MQKLNVLPNLKNQIILIPTFPSPDQSLISHFTSPTLLNIIPLQNSQTKITNSKLQTPILQVLIPSPFNNKPSIKPSNPNTNKMVQTFELRIENDDFSPKELTITQDDEIKIFISGFSPEGTTYTLYTEEFSSTLTQSQKLQKKFINPGEHCIKCKEITWMTAKIIVLKKIIQNEVINSSQILNASRGNKNSKSAIKAKKKAENSFIKKLKESQANVEEVFEVISKVCKNLQDNKDVVLDI